MSARRAACSRRLASARPLHDASRTTPLEPIRRCRVPSGGTHSAPRVAGCEALAAALEATGRNRVREARRYVRIARNDADPHWHSRSRPDGRWSVVGAVAPPPWTGARHWASGGGSGCVGGTTLKQHF
eukprot:6303920-Prymnesium_polylepis.1